MKILTLIFLYFLSSNALALDYTCSLPEETKAEMPGEHIQWEVERDSDGLLGIYGKVSAEMAGLPLTSVTLLVASPNENDAQYILPIEFFESQGKQQFVLNVKESLKSTMYFKFSYSKRAGRCLKKIGVYSAKIT